MHRTRIQANPTTSFMVGAFSLLSSCKSCDDGPSAVPRDAAPEASPRAAASATTDAAGPRIADASVTSTSTSGDEAPPDAGGASCRLVYGPAEQPFRGPGVLSVVGQELRVVVNDRGKPVVYPSPTSPLPPKGAPPFVPATPGTFTATSWPRCELAGRFAYCPTSGGSIIRTTLTGDRTSKTIAKGRPATRIAAASLGPDHSVVAFLDQRQTTEGAMLQAFVALDDNEPVRLSDDGAGATSVRFLPRGESPVAVYIDARTAMVPIHARPMSLRGAELALGTDAVIFVGGAPERGIDFAVSAVGPKSFVLIPMPRETLDFGMAAVLVDDPPKIDVGAIWSRYPNGLDPAPIAATPARDGKGAWVVRARPREKAPTSPRILELGRVDPAGAFTSTGEIAPAKGVTELAIAEDSSGALWILYGNTSVTWLERRVCGG